MCLIFSERLIVNVEVVFWSIRKLSEWSVLSVEIDLHALCRACVDLGGGLLTHISIMLASISHIWPKFWPIAIKFIISSDTHSAKITYGSILASKIFLWLSFKKIFLFNQGVNNSQRWGNNCNYQGEGRNYPPVTDSEVAGSFPAWSEEEALYADVMASLCLYPWLLRHYRV